MSNKTGKHIKCAKCGKEKYKSGWEFKKNPTGPYFCSIKCASVTVHKNPKTKTGKLVTCTTCGNKVYKADWELRKSKSDKHFCSRICSNNDPNKITDEIKAKFSRMYTGMKFSVETITKLSQAALGKPKPWIQGDKHVNWKGGHNRAYPCVFARIRQSIRNRDGKCVLCGCTPEEHKLKYGRKLPVHHLDHNKQNNSESNLVTLCAVCHTKETMKPEKYREVLRNIVDGIVRASQQCEEVGRNDQPRSLNKY